MTPKAIAMSKILIIDDQPANIEVAKAFLSREGYEILTGNNGKSALEILKTQEVDLLLLDIMMPMMDGFEVAEQILADETIRDIPIIFLTAKVEADSIAKGFQLGARDYLSKPFHSAELKARVRNQLELREQKKELELANATKNRFFDIMAHDLKNPFGALLGLANLLLRDLKAGEFRNEDFCSTLTAMAHGAKTGLNLTEQLLDWARAQTGRLQVKIAPTEVRKIAQEACELVIDGAKSKGIELRYLQKSAMVLADFNMASAIIRNLLSNAIKFSVPGQFVEINLREKNAQVGVQVRDHGVGMSPEAQAKLFRLDQPFTTFGTQDEQGTGLGLILCKEFAEQMQGTLAIQSALGVGTSITLWLPQG